MPAKLKPKFAFQRTAEDEAALWRKRELFVWDIVKTVTLGAIGGAALVPYIREGQINDGAWPVILGGAVVIVLLVIYADRTR